MMVQLTNLIKILRNFITSKRLVYYNFVIPKSLLPTFYKVKNQNSMKRIILCCRVLLIVCFASSITLVSCKSKKSVVKKDTTTENITLLKLTDAEIVKKKRADDLGARLLETCNVSRFRGFSINEATDKVRKNATKEKISAVCQKINQRNGRFLGINIIEIFYNKKSKEYNFRYNIDYEKKLYKRELFVTINAENKVSAISTKEVTPKPM